MKPQALIVRAAGTNCDAETAYAFELAGAAAQSIHINRILENPALLDRFQLLAFPGGFSYGDDIAAGKILANQIVHHLREPLRRFVDNGKPVIGICNGFQILVKTDLLPGPLAGKSGQTATLTNNDCGRFVDRWTHLDSRGNRCIWTHGVGHIELPIAHGEGKFVPANESVRRAIWEQQQVAMVYVKPNNAPANGEFPHNPNGSTDDIAGVCDPSGLVFGLMPHPERHLDAIQHFAWTSRPHSEGHGLQIFRNAVNHVRDAVGADV